MGRRRRTTSEDLDDSLEQRYSSKRRRPEPTTRQSESIATEQVGEKSSSNTKKPQLPADDSDKLAKKRAKRQRQKERKKQEALQLRKEAERTQQKREKERKRKEQQVQRKSKGSQDSGDSDGWKASRKGVKYLDLEVGTGPLVRDRKKVHVKYQLRSKSFLGKIIDSSDSFGFRVGRGEVITGWDIGLMGMRQGGRRRLKIPPQAGYGTKDVGAGKGGMLYFDVTLLSC